VKNLESQQSADCKQTVWISEIQQLCPKRSHSGETDCREFKGGNKQAAGSKEMRKKNSFKQERHGSFRERASRHRGKNELLQILKRGKKKENQTEGRS